MSRASHGPLTPRPLFRPCLKSPSPSLFLVLYSAFSLDLLPLLRLLSLYFFFLFLSLTSSLPLAASDISVQTREYYLTISCLRFLIIVTFSSIYFEDYSFLSDWSGKKEKERGAIKLISFWSSVIHCPGFQSSRISVLSNTRLSLCTLVFFTTMRGFYAQVLSIRWHALISHLFFFCQA